MSPLIATSAKQVLTGAEAVAQAWRQIEPDVVPVYPITPQTPIITTFAEFVAQQRVRTEIINVESEHSAMSAAVGAAAAGARVATATSSQGLALMIEIMYIASSLRLPLLMNLGARALSGPINIHCDHSDAYLARDAGWVQIFTENAQEAYDYTLLAQRLAEHKSVQLPAMVILDGFTITHSAEVVQLLPDALAHDYTGEYEPRISLLNQTITVGPFVMPDYYFEHRRAQAEAMDRVCDVWGTCQIEFETLTGRHYSGACETYHLDDAQFVLVVLGSAAGTAKAVIDRLPESGPRVGLVKPWLFRPFPQGEIARALRGAEAVAVLDRGLSAGSHGPLFAEICAALAGRQTCPLFNFIYGLGGRDLLPQQIRQVIAQLGDPRLDTRQLHYVGLRGDGRC